MTTAPTVLVLGATGRFGQAAAAAFARAGWQVLAQRRHAGAAPAAHGVRFIEAGVEDTDALARLAGRADVVVHAMNPRYTAKAWREQAPRMMEAAIATSRRLGALLMLPGNVYNFGRGMPAVLREDTPQRADTAKGEVRIAIERRMAQAAQEGVRSVVIRAGDFFGSGTGSLLDMLMAKSLQRGRIGLPGTDLHTATPYAYLPDLAEAFVRVAAVRERLAPAEVLHFRGHTLTGAQWRDALAGIARQQGWLAGGAAPKVSHLPWPVIRLGGLLIPEWASMAEMRYLWATPHALDNTRLESLIGAEPHTPLPQAVRDALAALQMLPAPALREATA
jgi:nucleoside-diphosphate-sugar epimerase